jgi:predicted branched-subunit amino acid permease
VSQPPVTFTREGVWRGFVLAQPLAPGVLVYALVFGALAGERGLSWLQATLMSMAVYSGSAQLAALQVWSTQAGAVAALAVTVLAINARYVLYGAAITSLPVSFISRNTTTSPAISAGFPATTEGVTMPVITPMGIARRPASSRGVIGSQPMSR